MGEHWNWARTFYCRPRLYVEPNSIDSLRTLLLDINRTKSKVRVIGCGHSPSSLSMSNEVLISMKHFNRIIEIDEENMEIHCESGVLIRTLNDTLPRLNLSLSVQGSIDYLTIAGAISTATHGSGLQYGSLSSSVRSIALMKLDGDLKEYRLEDDEDLFRCLTCSLGTFGVIVSVRLQLSRLFYLELNQNRLNFRTLLNALPAHCSASDHFRYMWYPHTNAGVAYQLTRVNPRPMKEKTSLLFRLFSWVRYSLIGHHLLELLFYISLYLPRFVRVINNLYVKLDGKTQHKIARCDKLFNFDCLFRQYASEWAVPLDQAVSCLTELEQAMEQHRHVHFPIEIRFSKAEDLSFLSPGYGRQTCWINTVAYRPYGLDHFQHRLFFETFEHICHKHNGRPHWAKEHPLKQEHFAALYPHWNLFQEKRRQFDPAGLLINDCLSDILS